MEAVKVSQAPAASEVPAVATPAAGGATLVALLSAVQDLARFFLSYWGFSSLGAVGGVAGMAASAAEVRVQRCCDWRFCVAGMAASAAEVRVQLCPSASAGGAVTLGAATVDPTGASGPPSASAAVPGVSGLQQCQESSRSGRRRRSSSSDGTDRHSKKRLRGRSPSPGPSSRHR